MSINNRRPMGRKNTTRRLGAASGAALFIAAVLPLAACQEEQGPLEEAGETLDDVLEDSADAVGDAARDVKDAVEDVFDDDGPLEEAADEIGDAARDAKDEVKDAVDEVKDSDGNH